MDEKNYIKIATKYAKDVVSGKIPASKKTIQCCQRQLDDLKRKNWLYYFNEDKANEVCNFIELLPHVKGKLTGQNIELEAWQCFWLTTLFGWYHKEKGVRRFTKAFTFLPRKNGKSAISAGILLYMLAMDEEGGAECYSAATTKDQAKIVFGMAQSMARKRPELLDHTGMKVLTHQITADMGDSIAKAVSADADTLDGLNPHYASIDELHAHKTREVYDVMETALGAREQPLLNVITTAGNNVVGICYEIYDYCEQILKKYITDDTFFCLIYEADKEDDFTKKETWIKANPNINVSVSIDYLESLAKKAKIKITAQSNFKTKHLNVWCKSHTQWMNLERWERTMEREWHPNDFLGKRVRLALDLAQKLDINTLTMLFEESDEFFVKTNYYFPENNVVEFAHSTYNQYEAWAQEGYFTLTPGDSVDYETIKQDIIDLAEKYEVVDISVDPWQGRYLMQQLMLEGLDVVEYPNQVKTMSDPMKELEALVKSGKIHTGQDPVLRWMASNVVAKLDAKDNIFPRKEKPEKKIDGIVSLIMALGRAILEPEHGTSVYQERGLIIG